MIAGIEIQTPSTATKNGISLQSKPNQSQEIKNGSPTSDIKMEKILEEATDGQKI